VARVPEFSSPYDLLIKNLNSKLLQFLEKVNKKLATADLVRSLASTQARTAHFSLAQALRALLHQRF